MPTQYTSQKSANKATILIFMTILLSSVASANSAPVLNSVVGGAKEKEPFSSSLLGYWDMDDRNATYVMDKRQCSSQWWDIR